ncbi:MAG TPA: 4'-phosphopantetheinyl transferase superfamily protein [Xanthobacteraceae bacterium]|nr:4'-phosphopantetheinyl transferase superfamily protein [Xanthobacteraceae bacterium]
MARSARFRFEEDRLSYIAAHWLLRTALSSIAGAPATGWRFTAEKLGKPRIVLEAGLPVYDFNLSHTRGFVACAVCLGAKLGIDVETLGPDRAGLDIATSFFSPTEVMLLRNTPEEQRSVVFFRLWTLKEAFIKATGDGLSRSLDSFSFSLDPVSIVFSSEDADEATQWQFVEMRPTTRHLLAVAIRRPPDVPISFTVCPSAPCAP